MSAPNPSAAPRRADRLFLVLFVLVGLYVIIAPGFLGWSYFRSVGYESAVVRVLVGFLFLFLGGLIAEKNKLRAHVVEVYEALNKLLYGVNYERDRKAIRILLKGLESHDENVREKSWESLRSLTGKDFALDVEVWRSWWQINEKRFALRSKRPDG